MTALTGTHGELAASSSAARAVGTPIETVLVTASTVATWPDGRSVLATVGGNPDLPVVFTVVDLADGSVLALHRIANSGRSHSVTVIDGVLHIASWGGGNLFRYDAAADRIVDLGMALPGQYTVASVEPVGAVAYGGTFPGGRLFRFDPTDERIEDLGQLDPGADMVRSLAWDGEHLFAGTEPRARLYRVDPGTGARSLVALPPEATDARGIDDLAVRAGLLFVHLVGSSRYHVLDLVRWEWVDTLGPSAAGVTAADPSGHVHLVGLDGELHSYDLAQRAGGPVGWTVPPGRTQSHGGIHLVTDEAGTRVVGIGTHGDLWEYDLTARTGTARACAIPASGVTIRSLGTGPGGRILVGGSLAPTTYAEWHPDERRFARFTGGPRSRIDAFATVAGRIHFSEYPGGKLFVHDPDRPWVGLPDNPRLLCSLAETLDQDRIFALLPDGDDLLIGSTGGRAVTDGRLLRWSTGEERLIDLGTPIPGHSVVSLARAGELVIGGTSVQVLGATPADTEAKVFVAGPSGRPDWYGTPQPGAQAISALTTTGNGQVWGLTSSGYVFRFDPGTRTFHELVKVGPSGGMWGMGSLQAHGSQLFGATGSGTVFALHTRSLQVTYLGLGEHAVLGADDALYWARSSELVRLPLTSGRPPLDRGET